MEYLFNVFICVGYVYFVNKHYPNKNRFIKYFPLIIYLALFIGTQNGVGTDYQNYMQIFTIPDRLDLYARINEYVFYYFVRTCWFFGIKGQGIFIVVGLIQSILLIQLLEILDIENDWLFLLLFFIIGTSFYNQFNGLRSATASYFITFAIFASNIYSGFLLVLFSTGIHRTMFLIFPGLLLKYCTDFFNKKRLLILMGISFAILLLPIDDLFAYLVNKLVPSLSYYLEYDYFSRITIGGLINKLMVIPLYIYSLRYMPDDKKQRKFYIIGFIMFCIRFACLRYTITNRIGEIMVIGSLLPLYYLIQNLFQSRKFREITIISLPYILIFIMKVTIFASNEYIYNSVLFN